MPLSGIHKRLAAFTLLELLVGMILSGIVLTATFTAYRIVSKQYESYCVSSAAVTETSFFLQQLESDFLASQKSIRVSENEILLMQASRNLDYRFSEQKIIRNDFLRTDTFYVNVSSVQTLQESKEAESGTSFDELHVWMNIGPAKTEKIYVRVKDAKNALEQIEEDGH